MTKNYSKFNISHTSSLKISKSPSLNPTHPTLPQGCPNSPINFSFNLNKFSIKNCSIFNLFSTIGWNIMKPSQCTITHQGLSNNTKNMTRDTRIWEISKWQRKQTNSLPSYIDFWITYMIGYQHSKTIENLKPIITNFTIKIITLDYNFSLFIGLALVGKARILCLDST